jgi:Neocarzinostatin family
VLAVIAVMALVAALAGTGMAAFSGRSSSPLPWSRFSLEYAKSQPCWPGAIKLQLAPSAAHVGEVLTLGPEGAPPRALIGGVLTTLEAPSPQGWSAAYFLSTYTSPLGGLGATPASAGYGMTLQGFVGPVYVRVPDVPAGTYRLVRRYSAIPGSATSVPRHANLCAALKVLPTSAGLSTANEVTVGASPSAGLHNGQRLRVSLSGFGPSAAVELFECAFGALARAQGCGLHLNNGRAVQVSAHGSASATVVVHDFASAGPGRGQGRTYPCLDNCTLVATLGPGYASAGTQLAFGGQTGATGTLVEAGGPAVVSPHGVAGHVYFSALDHRARSYAAATAPDGEFAVLLAPGRYWVSANSPRIVNDGRPMTCLASPPVVTVQANQVLGTPVTCNIK